jgi:hypothetical protein
VTTIGVLVALETFDPTTGESFVRFAIMKAHYELALWLENGLYVRAAN